MLTTLGAPERRRRRGRRGRELTEAEAEPVPTTRATVVRPEPFAGPEEASAWLAAVRAADAADVLEGALRVINQAMGFWRAAAADPYAGDVSAARALVVRVGFGPGEAVAEGRFGEAWELPGEGVRVKRSMEAPDELFAALIGARRQALAAEELVLRCRLDLDAGRERGAALQARVALEAILAELPLADLGEHRGAVGDAANRALRGELPPGTTAGLITALEAMEAALKAHRLRH